MKPARTWQAVALVTVALVATACGAGESTPRATLNGTPSSTPPTPSVAISATPPGWIPVAYEGAQVSVPADFSVYYPGRDVCPGATAPGSLFVGPPSPAYLPCPAPRSTRSPGNVIILGPGTAAGDPRSRAARAQLLNGVMVEAVRSRRGGPVVGYLAPSLGVEVRASGPLARRILSTITRSPRTVALATGRVLESRSVWHTASFGGLSFAVPQSWPVVRTSNGVGIGNVCVMPGVALVEEHVLLSTDLYRVIAGCRYRRPVPQLPRDGFQVDAGRNLVPLPGLAFSTHCLALHRLTVCPATSPAYSILVLKVVVLGRALPLLVSIGLAGSGMTARAILHSLRAA